MTSIEQFPNNRIVLAKLISPNLASRYNVDKLFDSINSLPVHTVYITFRDVETISRSFAQEYLKRVANTDKKIIQENVPSQVEAMFEIVKSNKKKELFDFNSWTTEKITAQ